MNQEDRLKALEELVRLDQELGLDSREPGDIEIDGHTLARTSWACPEQYDVFDPKGEKVGYLRLRHGRFRADVPDCGGETVYESHPKGHGVFYDEERMEELTKAVNAIKESRRRTI
jgi:hypothetical protein